MTLSSLEKACPNCKGNLHLHATAPHRERRGYDIHTYRCLDCGPMVNVTQWSDEVWPQRWDGPVTSQVGFLSE